MTTLSNVSVAPPISNSHVIFILTHRNFETQNLTRNRFQDESALRRLPGTTARRQQWLGTELILGTLSRKSIPNTILSINIRNQENDHRLICSLEVFKIVAVDLC